MRKFFMCCVFAWPGITAFSQDPVPACQDAVVANRQRIHAHIIKNTIHKNLSSTLSDSTEDDWEDALYALELINYRDPWVESRIAGAVEKISLRSSSFQRALLDLLYANYPGSFRDQAQAFYDTTRNAKLFAMVGEYLLRAATEGDVTRLRVTARQRSATAMAGPILDQFLFRLQTADAPLDSQPSLHTFLSKNYLPRNVVVFSFQRKDRNYPGLVMVRDTSGNFVRKADKLFAVPQLARSINNLPGYLTNGNTPEGIFRMEGFDVSKSVMIGPSTNIQLSLPYEKNNRHFYKDNRLPDSTDGMALYKKMLPPEFRNYFPIYQAWYAGKAGRTEIIAHGTTIDPMYYVDFPFFPLTPTVGCLCTMELWSGVNGKRVESDQQLLVNAIRQAGGPDGYTVVINIDDKKSAVTLNDIIPFLKLAGQVK